MKPSGKKLKKRTQMEKIFLTQVLANETHRKQEILLAAYHLSNVHAVAQENVMHKLGRCFD